MPEFFSILWDWLWIPLLIWVIYGVIKHNLDERKAGKLFEQRAKEHAKEREELYQDTILQSKEKIKQLENNVERLENIIKELEQNTQLEERDLTDRERQMLSGTHNKHGHKKKP